MKALPKKLLLLTLFGIAVTSLFCVRPAEAYTVTLQQMGANVVANRSGAFNLTGLTFFSGDFVVPQMNASFGALLTGQVLWGVVTGHTGFTGPTSFGSGAFLSPPLAAETLSAFRAVLMHFTCHWAMSPILLYGIP
jgi:hypothetical protein